MDRLDMYEIRPSGMDRYLSTYGWHFSKPMCMWAIGKMKDKNGNKVDIPDKDAIENLLKKYNEEIDSKGYDILYVFAMEKAKHWGGSLNAENHLVKHIAEEFEHGYDGEYFTHFYADCIAKGEPILWEEML